MATYIRCPECSNLLGKYSNFIIAARKSINEESIFKGKYKKVSPDKMFFNPNIVPDNEIIFNALNIKNRCCRMHLVTKTTFDTDI